MGGTCLTRTAHSSVVPDYRAKGSLVVRQVSLGTTVIQSGFHRQLTVGTMANYRVVPSCLVTCSVHAGQYHNPASKTTVPLCHGACPYHHKLVRILSAF